MSETYWIGTANRGFAQQAQEEIRRLLEPPVRFEWITAGELFKFTASGEAGEVVARITAQEPVFLRHLFPLEGQWEDVTDPTELFPAWGELLASRAVGAGERVAVQVRKTEEPASELSPSALRQAAEAWLAQQCGIEPATKDAAWILSVVLSGTRVYAGVSRPQDNLSDWPGGAVRFRREDGQISRAKFKLLEAELAFGLDFGGYRSALDIGAAPGGWTSLLLERGLPVTAVDPARLDASLMRHPQLTFLQKNAANVKFAPGQFDLLVCDMSWSHRQMARLVKALLYALQPGGTAVITVKLMNRKALQTIREVSQDLAPELTLQKAKQLFHNREELTLFLLKSS